MNRACSFFLASLLFVAVFGAPSAFAADAPTFVPLVKIDGANYTGLGPYLNSLFRIAVVCSAMLAVIFIVIGGFQYITSEAVTDKKKGREQIVAALGGLLLLLTSYILLSYINPQLLTLDIRFKPVNGIDSALTPTERIPGSTANDGPYEEQRGYRLSAVGEYDAQRDCYPTVTRIYGTPDACTSSANGLTNDGFNVYQSCQEGGELSLQAPVPDGAQLCPRR